MYLIQGIRFGSWKVRRLNWASHLFRVEPPRVFTRSSSLIAGTGVFNWSFRSHRNVLTINEVFTRISFVLFLAFQLLKNDGVTLNEPIDFVPTSCVALVRTLVHINIYMIIRALLNDRVQLTQRNMAIYFFHPAQDFFRPMCSWNYWSSPKCNLVGWSHIPKSFLALAELSSWFVGKEWDLQRRSCCLWRRRRQVSPAGGGLGGMLPQEK